MDFLGTEYVFDKHENFDSFLKSIGLPEEQITKFLDTKPISKLTKDGDTFTLISGTLTGLRETKFKSGVEFEDKMPNGMEFKTTYTVVGNTVTQDVKAEKGDGKFVRDYSADALVVTITGSAWDGVAKRFYKTA